MQSSKVNDFHAACRTILHNKDNKALSYAIGYADAGTFMTDPRAIQVQCLYILNNITSWRGPIATTVRTSLKVLSSPKAWKELV